jgi:thiol-disulfide isomerase/thioredoxin
LNTYKNLAVIVALLLIVVAVFGITSTTREDTVSVPRLVPEFEEIEYLFDRKNDTTYIINFWATSCPPCIKEMPHFEQLHRSYKKEGLKVVFISLDDPKYLQSRVKPFLQKMQISNEVILLGDANYSKWTEKVSDEWMGALPYTIIYTRDYRKDYFGAFKSYEELESAYNASESIQG